MSDAVYRVEYSKTGRSKCKNSKCKDTIEKGEMRIGKIFSSDRFTEGGQATDWFHAKCFFESQKRARKTTKKIDDTDDLTDFDDLKEKDQKLLKSYFEEQRSSVLQKSKKPSKSKPKSTSTPNKPKPSSSTWVVDDDDDEGGGGEKKQQETKKKQSANDSMEFDEDSIFDKFAYKKTPSTTTTTTSSKGRKNVTLKQILSDKWLKHLEDRITANGKYNDYLNGSTLLPRRNDETFLSLNMVGEPKDCKVVIFGQAPFRQRDASSGFAYCDESTKHWQLKDCKVPTKNFIKQAMMWKGYASKEDNTATMQEILTEIELPADNPKDWFKSLAKQGVLWLNTSLTCTEDQEDIRDHHEFWKPVIEEIIRTIFQCKLDVVNSQSAGDGQAIKGLVILLPGKHFGYLKNSIDIIASEFLGAIPMEIIDGQSPVLELFNQFDYLKQINASLTKVSQDVIDWWKPKEDDDQNPSESESEDEQQPSSANLDKMPIDNDEMESQLFNDDIQQQQQQQTPKNDQKQHTHSGSVPKSISGSSGEKMVCYLVREDGLKFQIDLNHEVDIGRRNLDIQDLSISRKHANVRFTQNQKTGKYNLEVKPTGSHPMYISNDEGDDNIKQMPTNDVTLFTNGQKFLLCSKKYLFTVEIVDVNADDSAIQSQPPKPTTTTTTTSSSSSTSKPKTGGTKRKLEDDDEEYAKNLQKEFDKQSKSTTPKASSSKSSSTKTTKPKAKVEKKRKTGPKDMDMDDYDYDDDFIADSDEDYHSGDSDSDEDVGYIKIPTRSSDKPDCQYWDLCYRKNKQHLANYNHPPGHNP
ncbi:SMAD/FHA domain-containing protein [Tieghemostelium lacteum]|uniref:SMAD/FHA domain-containing protein n=1 Tax=Tieghemostelium lacteum TaxID=361077 RepID=A0A152A2Z5_TIELA|nr:SMAD/FHA domain-containing protein [Tieghemostelium lacteum]|eukprot:KYR00475.1 SMAD/FHA domain-containing protein [Tieghemostelium lacteum]